MNGGEKSNNTENKVSIRPQKDFPFYDEFAKRFEITEKTIFAGGLDIYSNYPLTPDLMVHELVHLRQQEKHGLVEWIHDYLYDKDFRLEQELEAYREQLKSIKERNHRARLHMISAQQLASPMYGNIINYQEAYNLLKV